MVRRFDDQAARAAARDYELEYQVGHLFRRAHQRAKAMFADRVGEPKLTSWQFAALIKIREGGAVSQNKLGRMTAMDPATVQGVVQRLVAKKLVLRERDPDDNRRALLYLTPEGEKTVRRAIKDVESMNDDLLAALDSSERDIFIALLRRITL